MLRTPSVARIVGGIALAGACLATAVTPAGAVATADERAAGPGSPVATGLFSPLSVAVADNGNRYFSQNFAGILNIQRPGKPVRKLYQHPTGGEVGAVSVRDGAVRFATTNGSRTFLWGIRPGGSPRRIADLSAYEVKGNPDRKVTYGFRGIDAGCADQFPEQGMPPVYQGIVESHPYATTQAANGTTYVADAAANAILAVGPGGNVRTLAVLPAAPLTVGADFAEQAGMPNCAVGRTYHFEGVPTDVEIGPNGMLYVSTLPGGPEDGSLGAAASVFKVHPRTGKVTKLAGGLVSATGLAVSPTGAVFVAELFAGRIARIAPGASQPGTFAQVMLPGDVEWTPRGIFATTGVLTGLSGEPGDVPNGTLRRFPLPGR